MKQLNRKKTRFCRFDKILVIDPLQRCMVRVTNDNSAGRLSKYMYKVACAVPRKTEKHLMTGKHRKTPETAEKRRKTQTFHTKLKILTLEYVGIA